MRLRGPPRERVPLLRERDAVVRGDLDAVLEREEVVRDPVPAEVVLLGAALRDAFEAVLEPADFRVPADRVAPVLEDFPRAEAGLLWPAVDRAPLLRDEAPRELVERGPLAPFVEVLLVDEEERDFAERAEPLRADEDPALAAPLDASLGVHLPDITRWAASATASAMIEPNLVALDTTLLAACDAVSAASRPASRIFLRAAGLALIAAAAAARPAASISLLSAALASLSTVFSPEPEPAEDELEREPEEVEREELLPEDFAIA